MPYFIISNFANGWDKRRSAETAASGSLRLLRNAFINEGGEIEKRKAFVLQPDLTEYGQDPAFKGRISGPFVCPGERNKAFFRHRRDALPAGFTAGAGGVASYVRDDDPDTGQALQKFWVQKSTLAMAPDQGMFHGAANSEFSSTAYVVESWVAPTDYERQHQHVSVTFNADEPTGEAQIAANDGREFQIILQNKSYVISGVTLYGSAVGDPTDMAGTGSWSVDLTTQGDRIGQGVSLGEYFGQLVAFGNRGMMFWQVDPDPAQNQYLRTVPGSLFGPRTVQGYGDGDLLYLDRTGIRSLQARDSSNQARISDVGSPVDKEIRERIAPDADDQDTLFGTYSPDVRNSLFYDLATSIVHRDTGQFWTALRDQIYVLSRYPSAKVLAWSSFDLPSATYDAPLSGSNKASWVADWCEINDSVVLRNFADEVYTYGGPDGQTYDDSVVEIITPFMDMGRPGTDKSFIGIDLVCDGEWTVEFATAFSGVEREIYWAPIGTVTDGTRDGDRIGFDASGTQIALRLTSTSSFGARLSEVLIHYQEAKQK